VRSATLRLLYLASELTAHRDSILTLIHRATWKRNSANFAITEFSEVRIQGAVGAPRALVASRPVPIACTRTSTPRDLSRVLAGCSISYKSAAIATAPDGLLAYRLQVTLAVPGLHPRPLARLDGGRHVRQIK
jgi:hypothetical protein